MLDDPQAIVTLADRLTLVGLLLLILWTGIKDPPSWVPWSRYREKAEEADYWRDLAIQGTTLAEGLLPLAERRRPRRSRSG